MMNKIKYYIRNKVICKIHKYKLKIALMQYYNSLTDTPDHRLCFSLFGVECGKGWYKLITPIVKEITKVNKELKTNIHIHQIKEKYGTLRFYSSGNDKIFDMIDKAEDKSWNVCEVCGTEKDIVHTMGWITTYCRTCRNKYASDMIIEEEFDIEEFDNFCEKI